MDIGSKKENYPNIKNKSGTNIILIGKLLKVLIISEMINAVPVQVGWLKCLFSALQQPDWSVRILIASTGSLVGSQYILISPHLPPQWGQAFQTLVSQCKMLTAKCLVRKHLGNSSSVGRNLTLMAQRTRHLRAWKR